MEKDLVLNSKYDEDISLNFDVDGENNVKDLVNENNLKDVLLDAKYDMVTLASKFSSSFNQYTYHFGNGNYFEGKWLNNLPHGEGKLMIDGKIIEGRFRFGKIIINKKIKKNNDLNAMNIKFKNEM